MQFEFLNNKILAKQENKMIGYVQLGAQTKNVYRVLSVFVEPDFRGQGIAGQLMQHTVEWARQNNAKLVPVCSFAVAFFSKKQLF